jgi:hypothetical protein
VLLELGRAGRLPHKIFMQAGERGGAGPRGLVYRSRNGHTSKYWDNVAHRRLAVQGLTFVVPVDVPNSGQPARVARRGHDEFDREPEYEDEPQRGDEIRSYASSAQVAELADELIVFHGETRHLLTAILVVVGLTALIVVLVSLIRFLR